MAIRFVDGFDHYATADRFAKWSTSDTTEIVASPTRHGAGAARMAGLGYLTFTNPAGGNATVILGCGFRVSALGNTGTCFYLGDGGTGSAACQVGVKLKPDLTFQVGRGGTGVGDVAAFTAVLGTTTNALLLNTWYWVELKVTIHASAGTVELRVNDAVWLNLTGVNTQATANATANVFGLGGCAGFTYFDDVYVGDGTSTFLGDAKVVTVIASPGNGALTDWTPSTGTDHGAMVDDLTPTTTDANSAGTVGQRDSYNFAALGVTGTVQAVQLNNWCRKSDTGPRSAGGFTRIGSTNYDGTNTVALSDSSYIDVRELWPTSPATAVPWLVSEIDGAEFGVRVTA